MKHVKNMILAGAISTLMTGAAIAGEVGSVTTFSANTPAVASQVNANFDALITAINDNNSRIAALEAAAPTNNVSGKTYALEQIGILLRGNNSDYITAGNLSQSYTLTLSASNTFSFTGTENEGEIGLNGTVTRWEDNTAISATGTWAQSGNTLTLTFEDLSTVAFTVASNGGVVLLNEYTYGVEDDQPTFTRTESSLIIGVEIPPLE